ncbi:MAG: hypothetical protein ACRD19_01660 [Terriglobia bacterium]
MVRTTTIFTDRLSESPQLMPSNISGRVLLADGDMFIVENAVEKALIVNQTQVEYEVHALNSKTRLFEARKRQ